MTKTQKKLFMDNADIIDWLAYQLSDKDYDPDMLMPVIERCFTQAVLKFNMQESKFEDFAVKRIKLQISKYKLTKGENIALSAKEIDSLLDEEQDEVDNYLVG